MLMSYGQRQTVVSQFFQLDKLVVEGGKSVSSFSSLLSQDFERKIVHRHVVWMQQLGDALFSDYCSSRNLHERDITDGIQGQAKRTEE